MTLFAPTAPCYAQFSDAQYKLGEIRAIDYYLANQLVEAYHDYLTPADTALFWHTVVAVNLSLSEGKSCLLLQEHARLKPAEQGDGYMFPPLSTWLSFLNSLPISAAHTGPLVLEGDKLYFRRYYAFEVELAGYLRPRLQTHYALDHAQVKTLLQCLFPKPSPDIDWQKVAVANALRQSLALIIGGPGTGKTTTVAKLLAALLMRAEKEGTVPLIRMAAPTGKAAQRLSESIRHARQNLQSQIPATVLAQIPDEAQTIHRLLGVIPQHLQFRHHQHNHLDVDILLLDEVSMIDLPLMTRLFRALPEHCRVIMLGDADQLPSVAAGSVLADLAPRPSNQCSSACARYLQAVTDYPLPTSSKTDTDHITELTYSHRFKGDGGIGQLARRVIQEEAQPSWTLLQQGDPELSYVDPSRQSLHSWIEGIAEQHYRPLFNRKQCPQVQDAFAQLATIRILTPMNQGDFGVQRINERIEHYLRAQGRISHQQFYHGRPIMVTENNYGLQLFNGDIGLIWQQEQQLLAAFPHPDGHIRWINPLRLPSIQTVYAMTIHKTQGSEYQHVALLLPAEDNPILTKELLYTGITRAKQGVEIYSHEHIWKTTVCRKVSRSSGLYERLFG